MTYNVAVSGMTNAGTVIATIDATKATDGLGNANSASSSTDNSVTFDANGTILASGGDDGTVKLWNAKSGAMLVSNG